MIDDRKLTRRYKEMQEQGAPDLWNRIESELQPVDRSVEVPQGLTAYQEQNNGKAGKETGRPYRKFGWVAAAAAVLGVIVIGSRQGIPAGDMSGSTAIVSENGVTEAVAEDFENASATTLASDAVLLKTSTLQVPANARTVPYDAEYFSEDILRETDLLCGAVITDVSFIYDDQGNAIYVNYDMTVSKVYYAEDYVSGMDEISVTSPIIETDGDEAYLLYQMQIGRHYLLPLTGQQGNWELLYPFAPQIQVLDEQSYQFHSGYSSLINYRTEVTKGTSEGENDFYYDRMLIREDSDFITDLISLVK